MDYRIAIEWLLFYLFIYLFLNIWTGEPKAKESKVSKEKSNSAAKLFGDSSSSELSSSDSEAEQVPLKARPLPEKSSPFDPKPAVR